MELVGLWDQGILAPFGRWLIQGILAPLGRWLIQGI